MPGLFVKRHAELLSNTYLISVLYVHADLTENKNFNIEISLDNEVYTVRVYYKKIKSDFPVLSYFNNIFRFFKALLLGYKEIVKHSGKPDLIHVNILTRVGLFALFLKLTSHIPYVITEHWTRYLPERKDFNGLLRKFLTKLVIRNSSALSTVSVNLKEAMGKYGLQHKSFYLVNNIVDFDFFKPALSDLQGNIKIFSNITCFDDFAKNVFGIVRSVYELSKLRTDFLCIMVGDGIDRSRAELLAEQLGVKDIYIKFTGVLEGKNLVDIYNMSAFTILFSNHENMPVVIPESFACGKPVISTRVGGIHEVVNETNGLLIVRGDEKALQEKIIFMLDNYLKYNPDNIRNEAYNRFGSKAVKNQLLDMYSVVSGRSEN